VTDDPSVILEAIAPEVADDDAAPLHIALAEKQTGKVYRDMRAYAVALLAAHTLTLAGRRGTSGAVTGAREGELQLQYAQRQDATRLDSTSHGQELERLRRQYIFSARTVLV